MNPENIWEKRDRISAEEIAKLDMPAIVGVAEKLTQGEVHLHDIPVESFFDPLGTPRERIDVLSGLVGAVQGTLDQLSLGRFSVSGGTYDGIERGVILIRRG